MGNTRTLRIATVHILIDLPTDGEACEFLSNTLNSMPYVVDWGYSGLPPFKGPIGKFMNHMLDYEYTVPFELTPFTYVEGQFYDALPKENNEQS